MTALSANRPTEFLEIGCRRWRTFPVAANAVIYAGALVAINASGYLVPASADTTLKIVGIACTELDATGLANGAEEMEVDHGIALLENSTAGEALTAASVDGTCYAADDQTVAKTDGSTAGTAQVSELTVTPDAGQTVGFHFDLLPALTVTSVDLATDNAALRDLFNGNAQYAAKGLASVADGKIIIDWSDTATHTFTDDSSGGAADVAHAVTTAAVAATAATRPAAGKVHSVSSRGVYVRTCMGS